MAELDNSVLRCVRCMTMQTPIEHRRRGVEVDGMTSALLVIFLLVASHIGCSRSGSDGAPGERHSGSPEMQSRAATLTTTDDLARHAGQRATRDKSAYETEADPPPRWSVAFIDPGGTTPRWLIDALADPEVAVRLQALE